MEETMAKHSVVEGVRNWRPTVGQFDRWTTCTAL